MSHSFSRSCELSRRGRPLRCPSHKPSAPYRSQCSIHSGTVLRCTFSNWEISPAQSSQAQQNTLDAEDHTWLLILLGLASKPQQLGDGVPTSSGKCWVHITHHRSIYRGCRIIYARLYSSSHSSETGTLSTRCRLRMATFSSGVKCFRSFLIRSLRYLNGRTLSPFPTEAGHNQYR